MKRKLLSMILALAMLCSMFVPAMAAEETPAYTIPDVKGKVVIIHTNDTHGRDLEGIYSTASVAQLKKDFAAAGAKVLLLSAGDAMQGTPLVNLSKGAAAVDFLSMAGYDAIAPGNHEFDWGTENLLTILAENNPNFAVLSANVLDSATQETLFESAKIFDLDGMKVGVFGLTTPETATKTHPDKIKGTTFVAGEEMFKLAQAQVDKLTEAKCDVIVALGHLGDSDETAGNRSTDLLEQVKGIDLFIDGHSHTVIDGGKMEGETLRVSTGEYLNNIGVVTYDGEALTAELLGSTTKTTTGDDGKEVKTVVPDYAGKDETVLAAIEKVNVAVEEELSAVMGNTEVKLDGNRAPGVRTQETNLGDFSADAILWAARGAYGEDKVDLAVTNGGGIRASIEAGEITMKTMNTVFPFGNEVATIDVTGAELLEALEAATWSTPDAIGAFPQVAGVTFSIDTAVAYKPGAFYKDATGKDTTYYEPAEIGRVNISTVNGEAFDADATYTLATNDFTAAGGDTYGVFVGKTVSMTGLLLDEALVNYTKEVLGGTITAAQYGKPAGRISVEYNGIATTEWYFDAAKYAMEGKLMTTTGAGFDPTGTVTRGTVFQTLYNMEGKPAVGTTSFTDVTGKWYADAAAWAESTGIATVPTSKLFHGDNNITRAEIAAIFARYAEKEGMMITSADLSSFADVAAVGAWAAESMKIAVGSGIVTGKNGNRLAPNETAIRAELAKILMNYSTLKPAYTVESVTIDVPAKDGVAAHTMDAIVTMPTAAGKHPAVVMLHGTGSNKDEAGMGYAMAAPKMAREGIATIRFDFQGVAPGKEADYVNYNYTAANIDAKAAADYMAKLDTVAADQLGVMGWSQGGTNALLAAAKYPETFKAVVTWAGALDLSVMFGDKAGFDAALATAKKDGFYTQVMGWRTDLKVGARWFEEVQSTDVLAEFAKVTTPILAINGAKDDVVAPENADKIFAASKNYASDKLIIENCDHTYNVFSGDLSAINTAIDATAKFFNEALALTYTQTKVTVMNGEREVSAAVMIPNGKGPFPAVVMNHGHGGNKEENGGFEGIAVALAEQGIATIRMDFPGGGDSKEPFTEYYLSNTISDSNACKDFLVKNYAVDKNKLGILGYSMGGRIALEILGKGNSGYKTAVLLAGSSDAGIGVSTGLVGGTQAAYDAAYAAAKKDGFFTITTQYGQVQELSLKWFDEIKASEPLKNIKNYKGDMLVIYGDKDVVVTPAINKATIAAYPKAQEVVVPDADHGYGFYSDQPDVTAAVEGSITGFFTKSLTGKMSAENYLRLTDEEWFSTGKTSYVIEGKTVSKDTKFTNPLEKVDYTAKPGTDVVLKGTVGEQWLSNVDKVIKTYTKTDGTALTAADFKADTFIKLQTKAVPDSNFAIFIPKGIQVTVTTAWGSVLQANDPTVTSGHGDGDYIVCASKDGKPDLSDMWVVNGKVFAKTYTPAAAEKAA